MAGVLAVTVSQVPTWPAQAAPVAKPAKPESKPKCPDERPDVASAAVAAKLCDSRVEVASRRSETTQVFVNPDGTLTEEQALAPVRVRQGDKWLPVDLNLEQRADGSVAPKVHARGLRFAGAAVGAGEHEVVWLGEGDNRTSVSWTGPLPQPVLEERTVTYPEVKPGVDLVFRAHSTGYEQFLVVKNRAALGQVGKLSLPMRTGKLNLADDGRGGLLFTNKRGTTVGRAQAPEMWDAKVAPLSQERVNRARVGLRAVRKGTGRAVLELTPDKAFLARPDLTFPVTIDPPSSLPVAFDAFVQNSYSSDQSGASELRLGHVDDGGSFTARSYLRFSTSALAGSRVMSAKLKLYNFHSHSCTAASWEAWRVDSATSSVRWDSQPTAREKVGTSKETKGYSSSCGNGWVYIEMGKALQYAADRDAGSAAVMLRGTSETSSSSWKKFDSSEGSHPPSVSITYNAAPAVPGSLTVAPCYTSCGAGARTTAVRPTLSAKLAESNAGQTLQAEFEVRNKATSAVVATSGLRSGNPAWTNGSTANWQVATNLVNGTTYQWRVRGKDPYTYGAWSGWTDLTVDTDKPAVPIVSAKIYANDGEPHGGAGQSDTFTFTPAAGTTDLAAFVYKLDTDKSATTVTATGIVSKTLSPRDGQRTLTVQAKDRAGNLSSPNNYVFSAGNAALAQPLPGANVVKRTKLEITTPVTGYTRAYFEYRRGPGGATLPVPSANLTSATGAPITATPANPVSLASLGGYANWNATDTLGQIGGVVEIRARIFTATSTAPVYDTAWVRITVDSNGTGGATEEIGPGEVNLLTGDHTVSAIDADELGLTVSRTGSSRTPTDGYQAMPERLTANQQQVSTNLTGFTAPSTSSAARSTARGQGEVTPTDSLEITPVTTSSNDTYVAVGGDNGGLRLNTAPGKTYRMTGWIYVPAASGLVPGYVNRGLRIVGIHKTATGSYVETASPMASYTEGWQELSVDMSVPAGATEAFFRLYNGHQGGSGKKVYWDNLSFTEIVAPFGPSWSGGATGGAADADYTTLSFPQSSVARVNVIGGGWITFSKNPDGFSFTPEPGAEGLVLSKPDNGTYQLTDLEGAVTAFTQQTGVWSVSSSWTAESDSTTRYGYDTGGGRLLLKKVINPVEPGVDDTNHCAGDSLPRGCEVLEYVYATTTSAGLSQTVFGDHADRVSAVKIWTWDPDAAAMNAVEVTRYAYDNLGRLREVWDPRVNPPMKTSYEYDAAGRVTKTTPPGELPWMFDHANPDVDSAALRWDLDGNVYDSSGNGRNGTHSAMTWGQGNDPDNPGDKAATFTGADGTQITAAGSALSNTTSYTVSAWARITDKSVNRTLVSKDGNRTSGFFLNYVKENDRWAFSRVTSDSDSATAVRASSNVAPALGQWTHLAGVYDTATGKMTLYVNGVAQSTTAATGGWNASGGYVIGRAKWGGEPTNLWAGGIDDVRVYGKALTADQIADLSGDENPGRLLRVRRAALRQGSTAETDGELASNLVYNVPLTQSAGGPYNLDSAAITTWGQTDLPTDATAVFGPEDNPARNSATPATPGNGGYPYAVVHYLNANGEEVNTATPGGYIDTQESDKFGNVVRSLSATDRALALGTLPDADTYLAELGLLDSDTASRAEALSTVSTYSSDGIDLIEEVGPTVTMVLANALADPDGDGPLEAVAAGSTVIGRGRTVNQYDQNKPDGANYHLLTTETQSAAIDGYAPADARVNTYSYDGHNGGTSGWKLEKFTTMVADAGPGGANLAAHVVHDESGRPLKSWGFESNGADASTRVNIYYTAGANPRDAACGNRPEWAGLPCVRRAASTVAGHDPARMTDDLPVRRVTRYNRFGSDEQIVETAAGKTRTATTTYDGVDRVTAAEITSDEGTPVGSANTTYDPATGKAARTTRDGAAVVREYDMLGRLARYTDADGGATATEFDRFGKIIKSSDQTGWTSYAYDRSVEPRGLLTSSTDSVAGTFTAGYSPDEQLVRLSYPNGLTRVDRLDANQQPVERTYTRDSDGEVVYSESVTENNFGQRINHEYTGGSKVYTYDRSGRLTATRHDSVITDGCLTRVYSYDARANRTGRSVFDPAADGTCDAETAEISEEHAYDSADRLVDAGYVYDAFGRTTALPEGLTVEYHVNELVRRQTLDDARQTWTLDPVDRVRSFTTETLVDGQWKSSSSRRNHYADDSDVPRWIVEDTDENTITRLVAGPGGDLAATTSADGVRLNLVNLHGDVAASIDVALTEPELYDYDEFGKPSAGQATDRYGWLGGKQRSSEALAGVILMGVRLYSPTLGRFLQVDPVDGGNVNAYDYCAADPINCADLDGRFWGKIKNAVITGAKFVRDNPALICSAIAMIPVPPVNALFGAAAVGFSLYSAGKNISQGNIGAAVFDVVTAIPGAGALGKGFGALGAAAKAGKIGKTAKKFKGFKGAKKVKRQKVKHPIQRQNTIKKKCVAKAKKYSNFDKRRAFPLAVAYTVGKYIPGFSLLPIVHWFYHSWW